MSLVLSNLKKDLLSAFQSMTDGDDSVFAKKVSAAVADFAESGDIATVDAGPVSGGVFAGSGKGSISVDSSICEKIILAACKKMQTMTSGGDKYLAAQMESGIESMIKAGEVSTDVDGTVTAPNGATSTLSGNAKGVLSQVSSGSDSSDDSESGIIKSMLVSAFSAMQTMTSGGDKYFADELASAVESYLKAGVAATAGESALSGVTGTGAMS